MIASTVAIAPEPPPTPSLSFSLRMYAEESHPSPASVAFRRMANALDRGASWDAAVTSAGRLLPRFLQGVLLVAEKTGAVEQVLGDFFIAQRRTRRARRRVTGALLYPGAVMFGLFMLMFGVFTFLVPPFKEIFRDFGVEMPGMTKLLIVLSDLFVSFGIWIGLFLFVAIVLLAVGFWSLRLPFAAPIVRTFQALPILGAASQLSAAAEFCSLLAVLIKARIPLPQALRLTSAGMRDVNMRQGAARLARAADGGESVAYAASVLPHFAPGVAQVLRHQNNDRAFAEVLRSHGELFAMLAEAQSGIGVMWMQPLLLVFVGLFAGFVVIALFMPLITLLNALS